jgi:hypothetical protein
VKTCSFVSGHKVLQIGPNWIVTPIPRIGHFYSHSSHCRQSSDYGKQRAIEPPLFTR